MAEDAQGQTPKHQTDQSLVAAAAENIPACVKSLRNAQTQKYTTSPAKQAHDTNTTPSKAKDGAYTQTPEPQNNNETLVLLRHLTQTIPELNARIKNLEETTNHLTEAVRKHNTAQNQPQPPIIPEASKTLDLNGVMRMLDCKTKASVYRRLKVLKVRAFARGKYRWHAVYNAMRSAEEKRM